MYIASTAKQGLDIISKCNKYKYLCVIFSKTRSLYKAIKHNVEHAKKAVHPLYKRLNTCNLHILIDLQLQLFDHTILSILLYGCEILGFCAQPDYENHYEVSKEHAVVYALRVTRKGKDQQIKSRVVGHWISLVNGNESTLAKSVYNIIYDDCSNSGINYKWINCIKQIVISVGKPDLFNQLLINNPHATKLKISETLHDVFI